MLLFVAVSIFESGLVAKKLLISSMVRSQDAPRYNWHECGGSLIVISLMLACSWCTNFVQEFFCCWWRSFVGAGLLLLCELYLCRDACVLPKQWQTVPHLFLFCRGGWSSNCAVHRNFCPYGFLSTSAPFASVCKALKLESPLLTMLVQGPLAWALIVWRCSLVFSSIDKIVSVLIHLLPGDQGSFIKLCWIPAKMYVTPICSEEMAELCASSLQELFSSSFGGGIQALSPTIHLRTPDLGQHGPYWKMITLFGCGCSLYHFLPTVYGKCSTFLSWMCYGGSDCWGILK